jgi:hypothetical protein
MTDDCPWEPPFAGTETEHVLGALDRLRTTFRWKTDGLDAAGLQTRIGASADSPAQLYAYWDDAVARSRARFDAALTEAGSASPCP